MSDATSVHKNVAQRIEQYRMIREQIKKMDAAHEEAKKAWTEARDEIGAWLMNFLETSGTSAAKTAAGTAYLTVKHQASLPDPEAFMSFVIEHKLFDLLDRKANSTAVKAYIEEHKALPPGCNLSAVKSVGVRST